MNGTYHTMQLDGANRALRITVERLKALEEMGALEMGEGTFVVHLSAVNVGGEPPSPGDYRVTSIKDGWIQATCDWPWSAQAGG